MRTILIALGIVIGIDSAHAEWTLDDSELEISKSTGLSHYEIDELLDQEFRSNEPFIVRFNWSNSTTLMEVKEYLSQGYTNFVGPRVVYLRVPESESGASPLILPPGSVVFHRLSHHGSTIKGEYNPGLNNASIGNFLTNKWIEFLFWEDLAPGVMPRTRLLGDMVEPKEDPARVKKILNREFQNGWVIKGIYDQNTSLGGLISSSDDLGLEVERAQQSGELDKIEALRFNTEIDGDARFKKMRASPGFKGWRIKRALKRPSHSIVQEKLAIQFEYRVEVVGGQVLKGAGTARHKAVLQILRWDKIEIEKAEEFVAEVLKRLPSPLRATPMAMDVAKLENGTYRIIESNPQGNSGLLLFPHASLKLNFYLAAVPALAKIGEYNLGLQVDEQVKFIQDFIERHRIDMSEQFPNLKMSESGAEFTTHRRRGSNCENKLL